MMIVEFNFLMSNDVRSALHSIMKKHAWTDYCIDERADMLTVNFTDETALIVMLYGKRNFEEELKTEIYRLIDEWYKDECKNSFS